MQSGSIFTISSMRRRHRIDYGVLDTNMSDCLTGFREKPEAVYEVSMGVYMVNRDVLQYIPPIIPFGFDTLMLKLLELQRKVEVRPFPGYWLDIGRPDDYAKAIDEFESMRARFLND
ncbi:sugar phosphate nucleotidyltransferase [Propionivibrio sp.]|uniref:sugar phosphate nucleotidyltransferase n=1 Tax=Propionivibrio sp. TaxID=2212460 RepID=UPI0025EFC4D1|nr:sugar phosphate nucleotidyltransferase [Propionivibrio sp.]